MTDDKGLGAIPIHLDVEQAHILAAHEQLKNALNAIEYPKSGRWEHRDTAILLLEAAAQYVSATFDAVDSNHIQMSSHTEVLQDVILHFRQGDWGTIDRRLCPETDGAAGAAHDDALIQFKRDALEAVEIISSRLKKQGVKACKAQARKEVAHAYSQAGLTFRRSKSASAEVVSATILESWEKVQNQGNRPRAKCSKPSPHNRANLVRR